MPRIRTMKPEFWTDEKLSLLDPVTRLTFLGLISMADDAGRLVDNVKLLDGMLFPNTDDTCLHALDTLARISRVIRYQSPSGQALIQIANWNEHQKVDKPSKFVLPGPEGAIVTQAAVLPALNDGVSRASRPAREEVARDSRSDLGPTTTTTDRGPWTNDQGPPTTDQIQVAAVALAVRANQGLADHTTRPQRIPRVLGTSGKSYEAAQEILSAGVPLAFAESAVYTLARDHNADGEVKTLKYFVAAVIRAWQTDQEGSAAGTTRPATVTVNGSGRGRYDGASFLDYKPKANDG